MNAVRVFFVAFYFECSAVFEICIVLVYSVVIVSYLLCFLVFDFIDICAPGHR